MKRIFLYVLSYCFLLAACEKDDIKTYVGGDYIQFAESYVDSTTVSFAYYPGEKVLQVPVVMNMSSFASTLERDYKIVADSKLSTAKEGVHFDLPERTFFKKGTIADTAYITLYLTDDMQTNSYRLVLRVVENDNFKVGQAEKIVKIFWMHNQLSKPAWWDGVEKAYLGKYSRKKYELLIQEAKVSDLSSASDSEKRATALALYYYLQRNPTWDTENEMQMSVPVKI